MPHIQKPTLGGKKIGVLLFFYGTAFKKRKGKGEEAPSTGVLLTLE